MRGGAGLPTRRVLVLVAALLLLSGLPVGSASAAPVTWFRTGAAAGDGYHALATAAGTASDATVVRHGTDTGSFVFRPGAESTTGASPSQSGTGHGWATPRQTGTVPAGTWSMRGSVTTDLPAGRAEGRVLVAIYATDGGARRLLGVGQSAGNVLAGPGTTAVAVDIALPAVRLAAERIATEWFLVVSHNDAPAGPWATNLRQGAVSDTVVAPGSVAANGVEPPSDLRVAGVADRQVSLSWSASADARADGSQLQRSTSATEGYVDVGPVTSGTSYTDTGLVNGTRYFYRVLAVAGGGVRSAPSGSVSATPGDDLAPSAPTGVAVIADGSGRLRVTWNTAGPDVVSYLVERGPSASGPFGHRATVATPAYTDTELPPGSTWSYRVVAVDDDGLRSSPSVPGTGTTPPSAPSGLRVAAVADRSVALAWSATTEDVDEIRVQRASAAAGPYTTVATVTGTTHTDTGLTNGVSYYYRIIAVGPGGSSTPSAVVTAVPEATGGPLPPLSLTAQDQGRGVRLDWTPSPSQATVAYRVLRAQDAGPLTVVSDRQTTLTFRDSGLQLGVAYRYVVRALDASGRASVDSPEVVYIVQPSPPRGLRAVEVGESSVTLTWSPSDDPGATYRIWRAGEDGSFRFRGRATTTTFTDRNLDTGAEYRYYVQAVSLDLRGSDPSTIVRVVTTDTAPSAPGLPTAFDTKRGGEIQLRWAAPSEPDVVRYVVERAQSASGAFEAIGTTGVPAYLDQGQGLVDGHTFYWRVVAVDGAGLRSRPSPAVAAVPTDATPPSEPDAPLVQPLGVSILVAWEPTPGATRYVIERGENPRGPFAPVVETSERVFRDDTVFRGRGYHYRVVAVDNSNNRSVPSDPAGAFLRAAVNAPPDPTVDPGNAPVPGPGAGDGGTVSTPPPLPGFGLPGGTGGLPGGTGGTVPPQAQPAPGTGGEDPGPAIPPAAGDDQLVGEFQGEILAGDEALNRALREGRVGDALRGTAEQIVRDLPEVARTFTLPLIIVILLVLYLAVQGRIDRNALPQTHETATGGENDEVDYLL